ncbi:hypothetical protein ABGB16_22260 [Micromonospora sp. B11E3]|uniref:hypothetical protein n=1 Tax=Micromonospora sp. B11E3 TaxID=3153562 RepID=UPI00325DBBF1
MSNLYWHQLAGAALHRLRNLAEQRAARIAEGGWGGYVEDDKLAADIYHLREALSTMAHAVLDQLDQTESYPASHSHPVNWRLVLDEMRKF